MNVKNVDIPNEIVQPFTLTWLAPRIEIVSSAHSSEALPIGFMATHQCSPGISSKFLIRSDAVEKTRGTNRSNCPQNPVQGHGSLLFFFDKPLQASLTVAPEIPDEHLEILAMAF